MLPPNYRRAARDTTSSAFAREWIAELSCDMGSRSEASRFAGGAVPVAERIPDERIAQAAEFILHRQNSDGGFGTYERRRASSWLENVNPSEMFGQCMTERSYIECTASSVAALAEFREAYPSLLRQRIDNAVERAINFLRRVQRPDGSYVGFWGVNFTYAIFHVTKGLRAAGV